MKKLFPFFITFSLLFTLSACGTPTKTSTEEKVRAPESENATNTSPEAVSETAVKTSNEAVKSKTEEEIEPKKTAEESSNTTDHKLQTTTQGTVEYSLVASKKKVAVNESFTVDIFINTKNETVISGQTYIAFDDAMFEVESIDTKDSAFSLWIDKTHLDNVRLTFAEESGVKTVKGKVATLKLKTKQAGSTEISFLNPQTIASNSEGRNMLNMGKLGKITVNVN